jgi:hypothetical protein
VLLETVMTVMSLSRRHFQMLGIVVAAVALPLGWAWHFSEGHGASLTALAQVHPGMTRENVISLLGRPSTINRRSDGCQSWFYERGTFCQVKVFIDQNRRVYLTEHDH